MYSLSASFYDDIHEAILDVASATSKLLALVRDHVPDRPISLLDVACGTGAYLAQLREHIQTEGLDINPAMLAVANAKVPDVPLHLGDMADFNLAREFDAVICLGSSIGYALTPLKLEQTVRNLARHTRPGGLVVVEPWITPDVWEPGRISVRCADRPDVKMAQLTVSGSRERISTLEIHYLIGSASGVEQFVERHELGLFTHDEYLTAFRAAELDVTHDPIGFLGRGLYIGARRAD